MNPWWLLPVAVLVLAAVVLILAAADLARAVTGLGRRVGEMRTMGPALAELEDQLGVLGAALGVVRRR
ncbi:MAG: hypothetical protein ACYDAD_10230 [Acidimicrobiales bacterium]